jgi:hypothetical protein
MILPSDAEPPSRPRTVTAAVAVLFVAVLVMLLLAGLALNEAIHYDGLVSRAADATGATGFLVSDERSFNAVFSAGLIAVLGMVAAYFAGFAWPLSRGRNYARIAAWVGCGIPLLLGLLCGGAGLVFGSTGGSMEVDPDEDPAAARFYDELDRLSAQESRIWVDVLGAVGALVLFGLLVAMAVLLLVPPSNGYFRPVRSTDPPPPAAYFYPLYPAAHPVVPMSAPPAESAPPADGSDPPSGERPS